MIPLLIIGITYAFALSIIPLVARQQRHRTGLAPYWTGMLIFVVFVYLLETAVNACVLTLDNPVSRWMNAHPVVTAFYGALAAGVFEETGRLIAFRTLLRRRDDPETAVVYGLGHGGMEAILVLGLNYAVYLIAACSGFTGDFAALTEIQSVIAPGIVCVAMLERLSALMLHIALSGFVFIAARKTGKRWFYPMAILLHMIADLPAGFYRLRGLPLAFVEGFALIYAVLLLICSRKLMRKCL